MRPCLCFYDQTALYTHPTALQVNLVFLGRLCMAGWKPAACQAPLQLSACRVVLMGSMCRLFGYRRQESWGRAGLSPWLSRAA